MDVSTPSLSISLPDSTQKPHLFAHATGFQGFLARLSTATNRSRGKQRPPRARQMPYHFGITLQADKTRGVHNRCQY